PIECYVGSEHDGQWDDIGISSPLLIGDLGACSTLATAAFNPSCASEITSLTPRNPRRASERRKSVQNVSASEAPIAMPNTSRRPSLLTATATITATETMRPLARTLT